MNCRKNLPLKENELKENGRVDVITPTLNAAQYLDFCLLSTKYLRKHIVNHIVVDSGSEDETLEIASSHNVPIIYHPPGNMYAAINRGVAETASEWITYLNGDDIVYTKSFESLIEKTSEDFDIIYGNIDIIDEEGRFIRHWKSADVGSFGGLFGSNIMPFPQQGVLFRRSLWQRLGGFNEQFTYAGDFDFFLRAFASGARFGYLSGRPTAAFRSHGGQFSQNFASVIEDEGRLAYAQSALNSTFYERFAAMLRMRARNFNSYFVRFFRLTDGCREHRRIE